MVFLRQSHKPRLQAITMQKVFVQGILIIAVFFAAFFGMSQIDWMTIFHVEENRKNTEEKLGELFWDNYRRTEEVVTNDRVINSIDSLLNHVCKKNNIDRETIHMHILDKDEVNAFVLPGGHLIIYTGLVLDSDNQEEVLGVIGHELAHLELNHVMQKLVKEVGLSALLTMAGGRNSSEAITSAARLLSSSAFDRNFEKEADLKAVDYLIEADVDPEPFADFLYKMSTREKSIAYQAWISTHPESEERSKYVVEYFKGKDFKKKPVLHPDSWERLRDALKDE
jgi:beta-barrel assembly-enhancing protease